MLSAWRPVTRLNPASGTIAVSARTGKSYPPGSLTWQLMQNEQSREAADLLLHAILSRAMRVSARL